jgi:uncharacterized protein
MLAKGVIERLSKEFIRICKEKNSNYHAGMITNGYMLTKRNVEFLVSNKVSFLQVTVDGPKEIHDQRRPLKSGGGTYSITLSNIEDIADNKSMRVSIRINVDKRNANNISELLEDFKSRGLHLKKNISFNFGQTLRYTKSCPDISSHCMATNEFADFIVHAYSIAINQGFRISSYPMMTLSNCGAININSGVIQPNGYVQACWAMTGRDNAKIGIVTNGKIEHNSRQTKWLGWSPFSSNCIKCNVLPICMGGCPYKYIYSEDIADIEENICAPWKYNLEPMLKLAKSARQKNLLAIKG